MARLRNVSTSWCKRCSGVQRAILQWDRCWVQFGFTITQRLKVMFCCSTSAWLRSTRPCWWRPSCHRPLSDRVPPGSAGRGRARSPPATGLRDSQRIHFRRRSNGLETQSISPKSERCGHVRSSCHSNMAPKAFNLIKLLKSRLFFLNSSFWLCAAKRSGQIFGRNWMTKSSCKEVLDSRMILCWYFSITFSRSVQVDWTERKNWRQNTQMTLLPRNDSLMGLITQRF